MSHIPKEKFYVDVRFIVKAYGSIDAIDYVHEFIPDVEVNHPVKSWVITRSKEKSFTDSYIKSDKLRSKK